MIALDSLGTMSPVEQVMMNGPTAVAHAVANSPMFPPSFDNSPYMFAWSLCSRLVIMMMSGAVIVRIMSNIHELGREVNYAAHIRRLCLLSLFWAFLFGSASDVLTFLAWGEVSPPMMANILGVTRFLDGISSIPFMLALYVPLWANVAAELGLVPKPLWTDDKVPLAKGLTAPLSLLFWCVAAAIGVTLVKWWEWHGAHPG